MGGLYHPFGWCGEAPSTLFGRCTRFGPYRSSPFVSVWGMIRPLCCFQKTFWTAPDHWISAQAPTFKGIRSSAPQTVSCTYLCAECASSNWVPFGNRSGCPSSAVEGDTEPQGFTTGSMGALSLQKPTGNVHKPPWEGWGSPGGKPYGTKVKNTIRELLKV